MLATLVWGGSFVVTRQAVQSVPPFAFLAVRFGTAALAVCALTRPNLRQLTRAELRGGIFLGLAMVCGYGCQAFGMQAGVTSGRAAFISALYVPIVPLLQVLILRRRPPALVWVGLALACAGLLVMAGPFGSQVPGWSQGLVLIGAFAIAAEIVLIGVFAPQADPRRLAVVECAIVAAVCVAGAILSGQGFPALHQGWPNAALGLGLASAGLQISVNWAQRFVAPASATLIYTMEPVWAAVFGALAGEVMGAGAILGAALILGSMVISLLAEGRV